MDIVVFNGMYPTKKNSSGGIFVSQRIKAFHDLGKKVFPINIYLKESWLFKVIKSKIFKLEEIDAPVNQQIGINYENIAITYSIFDFILEAIIPGYLGKKTAKTVIKKYRNVILGADIIQVHWLWPYCGEAARIIQNHFGIRYSVVCHGSEINYTFNQKRLKRKFINILESAKAVEFVSNTLKETAISKGYSGSNAIVVPNGIDTSIFYRGKQKPTNNSTKVISVVGNLIPVKGSDRLVKIIPTVCKLAGSEQQIEFNILGDGDLLDLLQKELKDYPVKFHGRRPQTEVAEILRNTDILLIPSRNEGYPCVVKEAQACGCIVVGSDAGGTKEAIGEFGIVIPQNEEKSFIEDFSNAILDVLRGTVIFDHNKMVDKAKENRWVNLEKISLDNLI